MGQTETVIKLTVADNFSQNLRAFADQLDMGKQATTGLGDSTKAASERTEEFGKQTRQSTNVLTELRSGIDLARQAFSAVKGVIDETVGSTVEYAAQVRTLSRTIGASAEETSKLIQAADDVGISVDSLSGAMEAAIRKGVRPTIEGLGELSDQYLAIQDPIERSKFLMDNFGRSGNDLAALMEKGAAGIKQLGDNARETGLVMSQQSIDAARKYEIAIDDLTDRFNGLKVSIGTAALPALTNFTDYLSTRMGVLNNAHRAFDQGAISAAEYARVMVSLTAVGFATTSSEAQKYTEIIKNLDEKNQEFYRNNREGADRIAEGVVGYKNLARALDETALAQEANARALDTYHAAIGGALGEEQKNFIDRQEQITERSIKLGDSIKKLEALSWLTPAQQEQLGSMRSELEQNNRAIDKNAAEHDKATKKIILNMIEQQLATSALKDKTGAILNDLARQFGLIDEKTFLMNKNITKALEESGTNADLFKSKMSDLGGTVDKELGMKYDELYGKLGTVSDYIKSDNIPAVEKLHDRNLEAADSGSALKKSIDNIPKVTDIYVNTFYRSYFEQFVYGAAADGDHGAKVGGDVNAGSYTTTTTSGPMQERDSGGPGQRGQTYFIGSGAQPEAFVAPANGTFIPNIDKLGGGGSNTSITINVAGSVISEGELIKNVVDGLRRQNVVNNGSVLTV